VLSGSDNFFIFIALKNQAYPTRINSHSFHHKIIFNKTINFIIIGPIIQFKEKVKGKPATAYGGNSVKQIPLAWIDCKLFSLFATVAEKSKNRVQQCKQGTPAKSPNFRSR